MKRSIYLKALSLFLCLLMVLSALPLQVFAVDFDETKLNYYQVISKRDWELAPGIRESEIVMNNAAGNKRQISHVVEIDVNNPYTKVMPSTYKMAEGLENKEYSVQVMSEQAAYAETNGYGNVVAAMNTTLHWYDTDYYKEHPELIGEPLGTLIMDGAVYTNSQGRTWGAANCLVINFDEKDGVARPTNIPKTEIRWTNSGITGWEEQLIPIQFYPLVVDGVNQHVINDPTEPAPRSFIGIKEDGTVILVMNEGRQAPNSIGFNCYEMAEFMISLGCVWASNCDGGGSSSFLSQRPGEELALHCTPSDGAERPTTHGVLVISTAPARGEFQKATVSAEADYYTPGSTVRFSAVGSDLNGNYADIPAGAVWKLADDSFGSVQNGIFVSNGKEGAVTVQLQVNGAIVGEDTISIVKPDAQSFVSKLVAVPFGKSTKLAVQATYNGNNVILQDSDVAFSLSDSSIGSINGMYFTAAGADAICTKAVLTATICGVSVTTELIIGKESELIYSFENGDEENPLDGWAIKPILGEGSGEICVVNRSAGKVKNGDFALSVTCDFTQITKPGEHILEITFPGIDYTGAKRIGFWIYLHNSPCLARMEVGGGCVDVCGAGCGHDYALYGKKEGWNYVTAEIESDTENSIRIYVTDGFSDHYTPHLEPGLSEKYTFYIDDITLDYSDAVSDRYAPDFKDGIIKDLQGVKGERYLDRYMTDLIPFSNVSLEITPYDPTRQWGEFGELRANASGIDASTLKAWVDGVPVRHIYRDGKIFVPEIALVDGYHVIKFEVADNAGNVRNWRSGSFRVDAGVDAPTIKVVPRDPNAKRLPIGSIYWMDVVATDLETIDGAKLVFDLNNASTWELEGMTVAEGFTANYAIQNDNNSATIIIERIGKTNATGEVVLASIPVRTWVSKSDKTPAELVKNGEFWPKGIEITLETGEITYVDGYNSPVLNAFGMEKISVGTELFFNGGALSVVPGMEEAQAWIDACVSAGVGFHEHAPITLPDQTATCTQPGYTGRTFCEGCNSVVDWGTTTTADGHTYAVRGGKLACACGEILQTTGLQTIDGKNYYAVNGVLTSGWIGVDDDWYYFDKTTYAGVDGQQYADNGIKFTFENGRVITGIWVRNSIGLRYWYGPGFYKDTSSDKNSSRPYEIDGKTYLFDRNGYMQTGITYYLYAYNGNASSIGVQYYDCGSDGVATLLTGVYNDYFYLEGVQQKAYQLVQDTAGNFYFVNNGHKIAKNCTIYLSARFVAGKTFKGGTPIPVGNYEFDAEGKMILKHGLYGDYMYKDGAQLKAYQLVELNGDYYFVSDGHKIAKNKKLYLKESFIAGNTFADGTPIPAGTYEFGADGKMVIKQGIINDCVYINGILQKAYQLVELDGSYYFINESGNRIAKNKRLYLSERFVANKYFADGTPIPVGYYEFGADGKMVIKQGLIDDCVYINGILQKAYQLVELDGSYYFINESGNRIAKNKRLYLSEKFVANKYFADGTPIPAGTYEFGADGKMVIKQGLIDDCVYINGILQKTYQLVELDGNYYFINEAGNKIAKNKKLYLSEKFVANKYFADGTPIPAGYYEFDAQGRMVIKHGVYGDYLYVNGTQLKAYQLVEFEGNYYFVNDGNKIAKNTRVYLTSKFVDGKTFADGSTISVGYYQFDKDGKMILG